MPTVYYTGKGDKGTTNLIGAGSIPKDNPLFFAIGTIDELNSSIGTALFYIHNEQVRGKLEAVQNDLFILGAELASSLAKTGSIKKLGESNTKRLESEIDELGGSLPELKKFVLPNGCEGAVHLHVARAIARRTERELVVASKGYSISPDILKYINRLSSFLFVAALYLNKLEGIDERHPDY